MLDERRLRELTAFFANQEATVQRHKSKPPKRAREWEEDRTGSGSHSEEPQRVLADAGMVLREPSTMHLICHQVRPGPTA